MADEYDDYDYNNYNDEEPEIYDYQDPEPMNDGLDFELLFNNAQNKDDYFNIIEMEKDNSNIGEWTFKSYEKLGILAIEEKNVDEFKKYFEEMSKIFGSIDDCHKQDTVRNISYAVSVHKDDELSINLLHFMLNILKDQDLQRDYLDTGLQLTKSLYTLNRIEELGTLLEELLESLEDMESSDDLYNQIKLEFLILRIQYLNYKMDYKESKKTYVQAELLKEKLGGLIDDKLTAIIDEEGGKVLMSQKNYERALNKFKQAFVNYRNSGNNHSAKKLIKYSLLTSMGSRTANIFDKTDANLYKEDPQIVAMLELQDAYEKMDISRVTEIWSNKISKIEDDPLILQHLNDILHNIRSHYVCQKLKAFKSCKFITLEKELAIDHQYLVSILLENVLTGTLNAKLNLVEKYIVMESGEDRKEASMDEEIDDKREENLKNINTWIYYIQKQSY